MKTREYSLAQLGMLAGIVWGAGIGVLLFVLTGQVLFITITGLGLALGLGIGAGMDRSRDRQKSA